jgi:uncharacterized DUF497 family protein
LQYTFDWDPNKASINIRSHKITFRQAATVFRDPCHLSIYDEEHGEDEDRWITLGIGETGLLFIVVHTFEQLAEDMISIRIISARKATDAEVEQYREVNQ